jgi:hypothetical protein
MSIWVRVFCRQPVPQISEQELLAGISDRLTLLTSLLCPDEEEDPDDVLGRLSIEDAAPGQHGGQTLDVFWRQRHERPVRMEVWTDREAVGEQVAEALAKVAALDNAAELSARVEDSVATVAFQLGASDTRDHGMAADDRCCGSRVRTGRRRHP